MADQAIDRIRMLPLAPSSPTKATTAKRTGLPQESKRRCLQSTTKNIPKIFGKALYRGRARIEQAIGKLKRFKRIALRCEKTKQNFGSFAAIATAFILVKSVHTA
ncbi:MAG: transposase [Geminicoccaceae bacterium]